MKPQIPNDREMSGKYAQIDQKAHKLDVLDKTEEDKFIKMEKESLSIKGDNKAYSKRRNIGKFILITDAICIAMGIVCLILYTYSLIVKKELIFALVVITLLFTLTTLILGIKSVIKRMKYDKKKHLNSTKHK